jgi:hypothetical protein
MIIIGPMSVPIPVATNIIRVMDAAFTEKRHSDRTNTGGRNHEMLSYSLRSTATSHSLRQTVHGFQNLTTIYSSCGVLGKRNRIQEREKAWSRIKQSVSYLPRQTFQTINRRNLLGRDDILKRMYVAMVIQKWEKMTAYTPAPQPVQGPDGSIGCLLVYNTLKALRAAHPKIRHLTIRPNDPSSNGHA